MRSPVQLTREGVAKYKNGYFRISTFQGEYVMVPSREKVAEYVKVPDDILSFEEAANDVSISVIREIALLIENSNNSLNTQWAME